MKILIADDHELFSELIKSVVEAQGIGAQVQTCRNFDDAYATVGLRMIGAPREFDLIILDMRMPGMNELSGLRRMIDIAQGAPVAIISGQVSPSEAREAMREGAAGFLPKTMPLAELAKALRLLLAGTRYVPKFLMANESHESVEPRAVGRDALAGLTPREQEALNELMQGWSNKQIAENLRIAEITVKSHLMNLFRKLGAKNRTDAMRIALRLKSEADLDAAGRREGR
jgi:two-component system, NarL family, nitrate/nitrite response regulator NarL